jgi:hypothetical protein
VRGERERERERVRVCISGCELPCVTGGSNFADAMLSDTREGDEREREREREREERERSPT